MDDVCTSCGNDDAAHHLCSDCLMLPAEAVTAILVETLGGSPEIYAEAAARISAWAS